MSGLSPELRRILPAYKSANLPTDVDLERIQAALRIRLGDAAFVGSETAQATATTASSGVLLAKGSFVALAAVAVLGGVLLFATRGPKRVALDVNAASSVVTASSAPIELASEVPSSAPAAPEPVSSASIPVSSPSATRDTARASRHARDRLSEEVALLSRAQAALRSGKPALALEALKEHERKFGSGLLAEERIAASAQALCALGREAEADAQLARLSPKSVLGQHSRQACGLRKNN